MGIDLLKIIIKCGRMKREMTNVFIIYLIVHVERKFSVVEINVEGKTSIPSFQSVTLARHIFHFMYVYIDKF